MRRAAAWGLLVLLLLAFAWIHDAAPYWWRLVLALPAYGAELCWLQARERTCLVHAARGVDETDQGVVCPIEDATRREALMDRAVRIQWRALAGATIIVGILLLVP